MDPEPRNKNVAMPKFLWNNTTVLSTWDYDYLFNQTNITYDLWSNYPWEDIVFYVLFILIGICGMVGNGIVIWLLGFCLKRNNYGVYILNLAIADFIYLSAVNAHYTVLYRSFFWKLFLFIYLLELSSYLVGLSLLMAISFERCVSVLWPIWYKCHRPAHLSTIVSTVVWVFLIIICCLIPFLVEFEIFMWQISVFIPFPTILVLFVSSLTLFIRVQCYSRQRKPSRLYWTILLNVLAFLLFGVPRGVYFAFFLSQFASDHERVVLYITIFLSAVNSIVNPIIYFFVGRYGQQRGRKSLREVLQRALTDNAEAEERRAPSPHSA